MAIRFEDIFLMALGSKEKLEFYINNNIELSNYCKKHYSYWVATARFLATLNPGMVEESREMTQTKLLDILKRRRPDLCQTLLKNPKGMGWLQQQSPSKFLTL